MLAKIGRFLLTRFPEKRVVTIEEYSQIHTELSNLTEKVREIGLVADKMNERVGVLEQSAVHKGAVQELITVVGRTREEVQALKFGLGMAKTAETNPEIAAMLNGEILGDQNG